VLLVSPAHQAELGEAGLTPRKAAPAFFTGSGRAMGA
jgi:hypothetical protein